MLTDAALDALLPAEGFATLAPPSPRRSSGVFADEFPMVADATAAVSSFLFGGGTPPREGLHHDERRLADAGPDEAAPTRVEDADEWRQAVDDAGVPYFVSAVTGETARAAPAAWLRAAREGPRTRRGSGRGATGSRRSTRRRAASTTRTGRRAPCSGRGRRSSTMRRGGGGGRAAVGLGGAAAIGRV